MSVKRGDIVLLPFPWTDLSTIKVRPALVLSDDSFNQKNNDAVFLFITSKIYKGLFDFRLNKTDSNFKATGLSTASTFRISKIITLEQKLVKRRLGYADNKLLKKVGNALKVLLNI